MLDLLEVTNREVFVIMGVCFVIGGCTMWLLCEPYMRKIRSQ